MMQSVAAIARRKANAGGGGGGFDPLSLSPVIWLDASDSATLFDATSGGSTPANTADVLRMEDKSGNGRHFTESTDPPTRSVAAVNGLDSVRLQGSQRLVRTGGTYDSYDADNIFAVLKTSDTTYNLITEAAGGSYADATDGSGATPNSGIFPTTFRVNGADVSNTRVALQTARGASTHILALMDCVVYDNSMDDMQLNNTFGGGYDISDGDFCELLIFSGTMSSTDRDAVEAYLAAKWGITI